MELITVILVIAILSVVAYPLLRGHRPELETRAAARHLENLAQRAQQLAINNNKPTRMVINCSKPGGFESCYVDLQTAVYTEDVVTGWITNTDEREVFKPGVQILKSQATALFDGDHTIPNIFWAIFMPSSQVYSDPRGFDLFVMNSDQSGTSKKGWRLTINNISGLSALRQDTLTLPS
jgi:type II secretory pathway pseudopilin PulG